VIDGRPKYGWIKNGGMQISLSGLTNIYLCLFLAILFSEPQEII